MQIILDDLSPEEKKARFGGFETADIPLFETHFYEVNYSHVFTIGNDLVSYSKRKYTVKVKCRESLAKAFTIDTEIIEDHTDFMDGEEFSKKYMEILRLMMEVKNI